MKSQLPNMEYDDKKPLSTVLASFGGALAIFGSTAGAYPIAEITPKDSCFTSSLVIQTNFNRFGTYSSEQQSTHVDTIVNNDQKLYWSYLLKEDIINKVKSMYGHNILEIHESSLVDDEGTFIIYTALLDLKSRDYSKLLDEEWEVSEALKLYDKNIILRFV